MATTTTPFEHPIPSNSFLFDIYNDGSAARNTANSNLPGGPCNFVDLAQGANGAKCGCRRFWSRQTAGAAYPGNYSADQAGWCMCSHHACYHDDAQAATAQAPMPAQAPLPDVTAGQENEKPRGNREPLSPVQDLVPFNMPSSLGGAAMDFATLNFASFSSNMLDAATIPQDDRTVIAPDNSMPDTLSWRNYVQSQTGHTPLPPIPSECLMPSQTASTTSSSQMRYLRPFAGKGLQTLSSVPGPAVRDIVKNADDLDGRVDHDTPDGGANEENSMTRYLQLSGAATPRPGTTQELVELGASPSSGGLGREAFQNLSNVVNGHEQRLDKLENASFSVAGHEECHDKHDQSDLRITDLESRMEDVEKRLNDDNASLASSRRILQRDEDATNSVVSVSTNATTRVADQSQIYSQLHALQVQVNRLQAASLPSYNSPWEVEVVFLPFPLKGIWLEANEFPTQRLSGGAQSHIEEWTQQPNSHSRATPDPQSPYMAEWADQSSDWLLPRACAPGRMVDQRLKSRGLVKTISVRGSDARSVQLAIGHAFDTVLRAMPSTPVSVVHRSPYAADSRLAKFLGLQQSWVPLRKVHKDSRLRFLSPAELLTPVLWDVAFLMNSVIMKATGMQRLYVTQPEAYLQDHARPAQRSLETGWTWQKLRELSRVYPDSQSSTSSAEVPEADAAEEYWTWNDRVDEVPSAEQSGLSLRQAHGNQLHVSRSSDESSQQYFTGLQSQIRSTSPVILRGQSPVIQRERKGSRPPHVRTASMPPTLPAVLSPLGQGKRRVASYSMANNHLPYERRSSPLTTTRPSPRVPIVAAPGVVSRQRRRDTRSPSLRPRNTPRWSNLSMSRSPSLAPIPVPGGFMDHDGRGERRTTPFAYATPYSNAPLDLPPQVRHGSRSINVYEDDDMDYDDRGSSTDPYDDSEMLEDEADMRGQALADSDVDIDIDVYEDELDDLDDIDSESAGAASQQRQLLAAHQSSQEAQHAQLPEDEPWPGIEDNMSDGENMDPLEIEIEDAEGGSDVSSQPSEYPSTQRAWNHPAEGEGSRSNDGVGFKIHEDEGDAVTLWP